MPSSFDSYQPFADLALNGHQTRSENIAEVAGLVASYDAYHVSLGGKPDAVKDSFTYDQRFFISFRQCWRDKVRDVELRRRIATYGHAVRSTPRRRRAISTRGPTPSKCTPGKSSSWRRRFVVKSGEAGHYRKREKPWDCQYLSLAEGLQ